jgi:hypothetical protein
MEPRSLPLAVLMLLVILTCFARALSGSQNLKSSNDPANREPFKQCLRAFRLLVIVAVVRKLLKKSVPRAVASVPPSIDRLPEPRSLPLAVLIRTP